MIRLIALLALVLTLAGCGSIKKPPGTNDHRRVLRRSTEQEADPLDVSLAVGDTLRVNLASNPSTGYQWGAQAQISDEGVIAQRDHYDSGPAGVHLPGAPGTATWTFQALAAGTATVSTSYSQLWPGGAKNSWTFTASDSPLRTHRVGAVVGPHLLPHPVEAVGVGTGYAPRKRPFLLRWRRTRLAVQAPRSRRSP